MPMGRLTHCARQQAGSYSGSGRSEELRSAPTIRRPSPTRFTQQTAASVAPTNLIQQILTYPKRRACRSRSSSANSAPAARPISDKNSRVCRFDRRQTTRHADGAVATSCRILARADLRVDHMKRKNSGRFANCSGQSSGRSGRGRPRSINVRSSTRQNRSADERSIHTRRSARAIRLSHVAECPPSKIHRSPASTSRQRCVFSSMLRSTHPGCQ